MTRTFENLFETRTYSNARAEAGRRAESTVASDWLNDMIRLGQKEVHSKVTSMTPALAAAIMERNPGNRPVSRSFIEKYKNNILAGNWPINGQTIVISRSGELNDGQHRCQATIEAGLAVPVIIVFGVDRESRMTLDQGKVRTNRDMLSMQGMESPGSVAIVARMLWQYQTFGRISILPVDQPTRAEIVECSRNNYDDIIHHMQFVKKRGSRSLGGRELLTFFHMKFSEATSEEVATQFVESLISGVDLAKNDPILLLRNRLSDNFGKLRIHEKAELIIRGWNAWRLGLKPTHYRIQGEPRLPRICA